MRFATYNIRHGRGASGAVSAQGIIETLRPLDLDVIGMQEVRRGIGARAQAGTIADALGMRTAYGRASRHGLFTQGNAVMSRGRITARRTLPLPSAGERRACLLSELEIEGVRFHVAVTHLTLDRRERARAIGVLAEELPRDMPLVLLGDMNASVRELEPLGEWLVVPDEPPPAFPASAPECAIDHIVFSRHWRLESLAAVTSDASDHMPVVAELMLLGAPQ